MSNKHQILNEENSKLDKGEYTPANLIEGPVDNGVRICTDVVCCIFFSLFMIIVFIVGIYSFAKGQPRKLGVGYDPDYRGCGMDLGVEDYKYIYFAQPQPNNLYKTVCVKECPANSSSKIDCVSNKIYKTCDSARFMSPMRMLAAGEAQEEEFGISATSSDAREPLHGGIAKQSPSTHKKTHKQLLDQTKINVYSSVPFFNMVCVPTVALLYKEVKAALLFKYVEEIQHDFKVVWPIIIAVAGISLLLGFVFVFFIRYCAGIIIWLTIILLFVCLLALGVFCVLRYNTISTPDSIQSKTSATLSEDVIVRETSGQNDSATAILLLGIFFFIAALILLIVICISFKRIRLSIAILKSAGLFVGKNPSSLAVPVVIFLLVIVAVVWFLTVGIFLYSMGQLVQKEKSLPFAQFDHDQFTSILMVIHVIGFLWLLAFYVGAADFILGSATAIWYFQNGTGFKEGDHPILTSVQRLFKFHLGSVAFGSFLITLVWIIRLMLEYLFEKLRESGASENPVVKFFICCCRCCMDCFERFIKFLNHSVYIHIAMTGKDNFCSGAKASMGLILRNAARFSTVAGLGDLFVRFGQFFIASASSLLGYLIITRTGNYSQEMNSPFTPVVLFFLIGLTIGSLFMSVYGTVVDAMLIVYTMDEEIEVQHLHRPGAANCPEPLREFLQDLDK